MTIFKKLSPVLVILVLGMGLYFFTHQKLKIVPLRVVTWSGYFPGTIIEDFTKETGIPLEISYISSNEELFAKIKAGSTGLDIITPSDYMVAKMTRLNMLAPLNHSVLLNIDHLDSYFKNLPYDPGLKTSIPFTRGITGLAINTDKVKIDPNNLSWAMLFQSPDPRNTSMLDDVRESFAAALQVLGEPVNTTQPTILAKAQVLLRASKNNISLFTSEPVPFMLRGDITIAHAYSAHAIQAQQENPAIKFFIPKEGGVVWTDNLAIPNTSRKIAEAHLFLNYVMDPKNALNIQRQNHLHTPNKTAQMALPEKERNSPDLYPSDAVLKRLHFIEDIGESMLIYDRLWTELKT